LAQELNKRLVIDLNNLKDNLDTVRTQIDHLLRANNIIETSH